MVTRALQHATPPRTLAKPVSALAIVPLNNALTVSARKAYNVMLYLAQEQHARGGAPTEGFSAPLAAILHGSGIGTNITKEATRYIKRMATTEVEWRTLSASERGIAAAQGSLLPAPAPRSPAAPVPPETGELRIFTLLSEARLYKKGGEYWLTWFYPPSINEQLIGPQRWARLELAVIARLGSYTAVALYEICARYRDNPGGVTSRQPWQWWGGVLSSSGESKRREWRKFKYKFVSPAIKEINEVSGLVVELIEFKRGRAVAEVQFSVRRKPEAQLRAAPEAVDITLALRAAACGVREADTDQLVDVFGERAVTAALAALERRLASTVAKPVFNRVAYLKAILTTQTQQLDAPPAAGASQAPTPQALAPVPVPTSREDEAMGAALRALRARFEALDKAEQGEWLARFSEHYTAGGRSLPRSVAIRVKAGNWRAPVVRTMLLQFYGRELFGEHWIRESVQ